MFRVRLAMLAALFSIIAPSPHARGDDLTFLPNGRDAIAKLYSDISSAHSTIDMSYLDWNPCSSVAKAMTSLLAAKAKEGVHVRLVIDPSLMSSEAYHNTIHFLRARGIDARFFNDRFLFDPEVNFRDHAKVAVIDRAKYVTGGRNMADGYFGLNKKLNWIDRDTAVSGASATQAAQAYDRLIASGKTSVPETPSREEAAEFKKSCLAPNDRDRALEAFLKEKAASIAAGLKPIACPDAKFVIDDPTFVDLHTPEAEREIDASGVQIEKKHATSAVLETLAAARSEVMIENYTYVPSNLLANILEKKRDAKIPVTIYTNKTMDEPRLDILHQFYTHADRNESERIVKMRSDGHMQDRWELSPENARWMLHAKDMTVDGKDAIISSWNLDPRSYHTNVESALVVHTCPAFVKQVNTAMQKHEFESGKDRTSPPDTCFDCKLSESTNPLSKAGDYLAAWIFHDLF